MSDTTPSPRRYEGSIIRTLHRLEELLRQIIDASKVSPDFPPDPLTSHPPIPSAGLVSPNSPYPFMSARRLFYSLWPWFCSSESPPPPTQMHLPTPLTRPPKSPTHPPRSQCTTAVKMIEPYEHLVNCCARWLAIRTLRCVARRRGCS